MYLRFAAPSARGGVTRACVMPGFFGAAYDLWWDRKDDTPTLLALRRELDWFNEWLPVPKRFAVKARGVWWSDGICWFRDEARDMVAHANTLAALMQDCGAPVERHWTRDPGQLLYRDRWQVVAKPERHMIH